MMRCEPGMQENKDFTRISFLKCSRYRIGSTSPHTAAGPGFCWLNNNPGRCLYVVLSSKEMCILFYLLFPRFCIISKQGPMHPLFSFGTCIWFDNFILEKLLLFIVFRNSTAARMHFPFSAPSRMHFNTKSHILENITASHFYIYFKISTPCQHREGSSFPSVYCFMFSKLTVFPQKYS